MKRRSTKMNQEMIKHQMYDLHLIEDIIVSNDDDQDVIEEVQAFSERYAFFDDFEDVSDLSDGVIELVCTAKKPEDPIKNYVPAYHFDIVVGYEHIGEVNLRIGHTKALYYGGHIGYNVDEKHRGKGYAVRACQLLKNIALKHEVKQLFISNRYDNVASIRVCQKLGAKYIRTVLLPEDHEMRKDDMTYINIWILDIVYE